jgi:hypothetical protein
VNVKSVKRLRQFVLLALLCFSVIGAVIGSVQPVNASSIDTGEITSLITDILPLIITVSIIGAVIGLVGGLGDKMRF